MTVRLVNKTTMSSIQKNQNEDVNEAVAILEEETQQRILDIQQRIEFVCASLRAQGNTEMNKMLMSVRKLTMEQFCEAYEANPQKFLEHQTQQMHAGSSHHDGFKRTHSFTSDTVDKISTKKTKPNAISVEVNDTSSSATKYDDEEAKDGVEKPHPDVTAPQNDLDLLRQDIKESRTNTQKQLPNEEPVVISIKRQNHATLDIKLHTRGVKEHFVVESAIEKLNQLDQHQKSHVRSQIEDLQEKLDIIKQSIS
ncbi:hypothetical protein BD408DRAFT_417043 [Parasitella parasitica]|nr:hypothetical protein BD408DRAFT_417043 [Parasitella parasitica]